MTTAVKSVKKTAAKKTAVKKTATGTKRATRTRRSTVKPDKAQTMTPEARFRTIELEAFLLAEKDNFKNDPISYWFQAEKNIG